MQINRLLEIVYVLLRSKTVTAQELAERFGVSSRTIYRDIDTLSLSGIPVYTEKGKGGGISLLPQFVLDKSILSDKEQADILAALQSFSVVSPVETEQALTKLSAVFNRSVVDWLEVDFTGWSYTGGDVFHGLKEAILNRRVVSFDYYSTYGEKTSRRAEPIQLWFKSRAWYVKCFCLTRRAVRLFKLTRVRELAVTDEPFETHDFSGAPEPEHNEPHERPDITIVLKIAPEMTYRVYDEFAESQVIKQSDGSFCVTVTWPEDDWVYGTILSYGEYAEVLEPAALRDVLREKAKKIWGLYS